MGSLFSCRAFAGFGPLGLAPGAPAPAAHVVSAARRSLLRARLRATCPQRPGVYGMLDARGDVIYVGKAKRLRTRLLCYFRPASRDPKAGRILADARAIAWEYTPSEFAALLRELELIRRWRPRFNVFGQPHRRRRTYVCLGRRPAPYAFLSARPPAGAVAAFGPVPAGRRAREAVRRVNDWFGLRDCPQAQVMCFTEQAELFPVVRAAGCLRYEIGTCLGPCAGACTGSAYRDQVRAARAFLAGRDATPLERLDQEMARAAAALEFERAAALRDKREVLGWLRGHLDRLHAARDRHSFVYPVPGHEGADVWYVIRRGEVVAALPAPRTEDERQAARAAVAAAFAGPARAAEDVEGIYLVAAWFRRQPAERARTIDPAGLTTGTAAGSPG